MTLYNSKYWTGLVLFFAICLLSSCGNKENKSEESLRLFRYNQATAVTSLDPAFARNQSNNWAVNHLFNGLVSLDNNLNVVPCIAKRWEVSDDGLLYTFYLRDDVHFHDSEVFENGKGRKVVAEDVVYSFNRIINPQIQSPGAWLFNDRVAKDSPFTAIDEQTFQLKLLGPFRPMLSILSMQYCSIIPKEAIDKYGASFRTNPVGTGAFTFKKWIENQSLILSKNENYFEEGQPSLDGIRVDFVKDRNTAYLQFMKGDLDFMSGLVASIVDELLTKEGELQAKHESTIDFVKAPFLNTEYLGINMSFEEPNQKNSPLRFKEVRQALNYGFDREKMLRELRNNVGKPANSGFCPRGLPSFNAEKVKGYNYNPEKARELLAAAGYPNGKGMPVINLQTNNDYEDICIYIKRQWEDLGVKVNIDLLESATLRELMSNGKAGFFRASWIADYPDAESFYTVFYGKNPAPPNYTQFKNTSFDKLYEQALNENDDNKRYELYQEMDRILIEEAPVVFLFYDETARFSQKAVRGLNSNALNLLSLKKVKID